MRRAYSWIAALSMALILAVTVGMAASAQQKGGEAPREPKEDRPITFLVAGKTHLINPAQISRMERVEAANESGVQTPPQLGDANDTLTIYFVGSDKPVTLNASDARDLIKAFRYK